jgi:preprotein translocase subunit SecE
MAENEKKVAKTENKPAKPEKKEKKKGRVKEAWRGFKSELKKIVWPSGKQTFKNLLVVLIVIIVSALLIALLDYAFANGMTALTKLFS